MAFNDHYQYFYKGIKLDPYRVIEVWEITHPAHQQALKKIARCGKSIKDLKQDIDETIEALERWKEMLLEDEGIEPQDEIIEFNKKQENKTTPEQIKKYEIWRNQLISTAVQEFGYSLNEIETLASGNKYQIYFEGGNSPYEALTNSFTILKSGE
jgi:hypothetical protein